MEPRIRYARLVEDEDFTVASADSSTSNFLSSVMILWFSYFHRMVFRLVE